MRRTLQKKLIRDVAHLRGQIAATALVVACGVASFVSMRSTYDSLVETQSEYYAKYRFAEVFGHVTRAPNTVRLQLQQISGVASVQTRVVSDAMLDLPGVAEPAQSKIISIPERQQPLLNDVYLVRGRYIQAGTSDEVLVSEGFADANGFQSGNNISAVINGRWRKLTIAGVAMSPEFLYEIRPGDIFPDNKRFGIIWMGEKSLGPALDMDGAFNDVSATLVPGASAEEVVDSIDRVLNDYGGTGAYLRRDQTSYRFLANEFSQLRTFGTFLPVIFLGVTAFLLNLVMSRLVRTQREQIGLLKAFGYSNQQIGTHFLLMAFIAASVGLVVGIILGIWMGGEMTALYTDYFHFPDLRYRARPMLLLYSLIITFAAAAIGAVSAVRYAVKLPPAQAMQPEAPQSFKPGIMERFGISQRLSPAWRIVARNLSRQPSKAVLGAAGIAAAASLLFTGFYFYDAINRIIEVQFRYGMREDIVITLTTTRQQRARTELASLTGVRSVETFRAVPTKLTRENHSKRVALLGVEERTSLHRIVDQNGAIFSVPSKGLVLSTALSKELRAGVGDVITINVLEGDRPIKQVPVSALVDELMGMNAYMDIRALNSLMNEDDLISGAYLAVDEDKIESLFSRLKKMPSIAGVALPGAILKSFNETFAKTIGIFTFILVCFSGAIVFGVVYNAARIALSERSRELASLRVLGFTRTEISEILLGEHAILTIIAVPAGFVLGYGICATMNNLVDTEMLRLPMVFSLNTFVLTTFYISLAALLSGLLISLRIRKLDLIAVLKTRE